jgi:hypothetical protein
VRIWNSKERDATRIMTAEVEYRKKPAIYTWTDYKINTQIAKEINVTPVLDKIQEYRRNCLKQMNRMLIISYRE